MTAYLAFREDAVAELAMFEHDAAAWNERVEQELTCAVRARDTTARKAHFELAILHLEAGCEEQDVARARDRLSTALFTRMAFLGEDA